MSALNQGQQAAADAFGEFLFSPEPYFNISGPGGVGKTHLMSHLIDHALPRYFDTCRMMGMDPLYQDVTMTATTNKAAEVLAQATGRPTSTLHSFLNLKVVDDYETGRSKISKTNNWKVHERKILFADECSTIDWPLLEMIKEGMHQSKVIFVGDHCQLPPVMEKISPIYRLGMPFYELTQPMRNAGQPALMALCQQLRETVETGVFKPIQIVPGVIDLLDDSQMQAQINHTFAQQTKDSRILAYSNRQVMLYNDYIRSIRQLPQEYQIGEYLVNNSAIQLKGGMLSVEEEITIISRQPDVEIDPIDPSDPNSFLEYRMCTIETSLGDRYTVPIPLNKNHHNDLMKYYGRVKNWERYFHLKNKYPDLRQRDASTIHKSQGSSYDTVFIDLGNVSTCPHANVAAKLLYVALSRARTRVFLYGSLADKYGGLII